MNLYIPKDYNPVLDPKMTQEAIKYIRDRFQKEFSRTMNFTRVSAPLFVTRESGLNDNLNGIERPVSFDILEMPNHQIEVVQSLAKWKRLALHRYNFDLYEGFYTNMNAIRRDETLDNTHSCYVDQWDWEMIIKKEDRSEEKLKEIVRKIFKVIKYMEHEVWYKYPEAVYHLPDDVYFISSQELEDKYPQLSPKQRENEITKEFGCVFIMKIGAVLNSGIKHDDRAPDYDDWELNGDLFFWHDNLKQALELSSMGIRVDDKSLKEQCSTTNNLERLNLPFHKAVLNGELPYTIGGGIGQSRLCMLLLNRAHVGEVQASIWPAEMIEECKKHNIILL
ncbi:MAG: aspartate--ammonia ligase [Anaerorhabdus sp.]